MLNLRLAYRILYDLFIFKIRLLRFISLWIIQIFFFNRGFTSFFYNFLLIIILFYFFVYCLKFLWILFLKNCWRLIKIRLYCRIFFYWLFISTIFTFSKHKFRLKYKYLYNKLYFLYRLIDFFFWLFLLFLLLLFYL